MTSFTTRENRRKRIATIIFDTIPDNSWFCAHDIYYEYAKRWRNCMSVRDIAKMLPIYNLPYDKSGAHKKYFKKEYSSVEEIYVVRVRD